MSDAATDPVTAPVAPPPRRIPGYGEFLPLFEAASDTNPNFAFYSLGGKWTVLMFHGSLGPEPPRRALETVMARRALFDDKDAYFFGVSIDAQDRTVRGLKNAMPGMRYFWDFDGAVSRLYGVARGGALMPMVFLADRSMRIVEAAPIEQVARVLDRLERELAAERAAQALSFAPVLMLPRIFEPELCAELVAYYEAVGGQRSGFMQTEDGKTVGRQDEQRKRRRDATIVDQSLLDRTRQRLTVRLLPAVARAFGWQATRIERYIVAHYSGQDQGFFFPHRDNTSPGTAHRKFAVTINLNAEDYDGGELRFPEFGPRTYKPPTGGAVVFGCSLLHEATPVTRGERYAFVPFLYDEEGRRVRTANAHTIVSLAEDDGVDRAVQGA